MKIILGGAQFGLDYGISNTDGKTSDLELNSILDYANKLGVDAIDTASEYGDSELRIGANDSSQSFKIISKFPHLDVVDNISLEHYYYKSLERLKRDSIYAYLFHDADDLIIRGDHYKFSQLKESLNDNKTKIGCSVYSVEQLIKVTSEYELEIIQLPLNILNQSFIKSGILRDLKERGIEIHARSLFLQGLLLLNTNVIPDYFNSIKPLLETINEDVRKNRLARVSFYLNFINRIDDVDKVVIGINNCSQLKEIIAASTACFEWDYSKYAIDDNNIINPSNWKVSL